MDFRISLTPAEPTIGITAIPTKTNQNSYKKKPMTIRITGSWGEENVNEFSYTISQLLISGLTLRPILPRET